MSSKGRKPKGKHTLTIHFDTKVGRENFMAWYSNSGEQDSHYYEKAWGKDWAYVKPPEECCPKCEYYVEDIQTKSWENKNQEWFWTICENCTHNYMVKNVYFGDK